MKYLLGSHSYNLADKETNNLQWSFALEMEQKTIQNISQTNSKIQKKNKTQFPCKYAIWKLLTWMYNLFAEF